MRVIANKNKKSKKKFPRRIVLENGCSLVAFFMALRFRGIKKNMQQCLSYARRRLKCGAKYPLTEICRGINMICSGKSAVYHKSMTDKQLKTHLQRGHMVLFEESNPIHTVVLLMDSRSGKIWRFSDGKKNVTTVEKENKKRCTNEKYRGIVIVK